jgi:hypothetical protein
MESEMTILECYQESDQEAMKTALKARNKPEEYCHTQLPHPQNPKFVKGV